MRRSENYIKTCKRRCSNINNYDKSYKRLCNKSSRIYKYFTTKTNTRIYGNTINKLCALFLHRMHTLMLSARVVKETRWAGIFWLWAGISFLGARRKNDSLGPYLLALDRNPPPPVVIMKMSISSNGK